METTKGKPVFEKLTLKSSFGIQLLVYELLKIDFAIFSRLLTWICVMLHQLPEEGTIKAFKHTRSIMATQTPAGLKIDRALLTVNIQNQNDVFHDNYICPYKGLMHCHGTTLDIHGMTIPGAPMSECLMLGQMLRPICLINDDKEKKKENWNYFSNTQKGNNWSVE